MFAKYQHCLVCFFLLMNTFLFLIVIHISLYLVLGIFL